MVRPLEGKMALVTGAGHEIGRGHALQLAKHGAAVIVSSLENIRHQPKWSASTRMIQFAYKRLYLFPRRRKRDPSGQGEYSGGQDARQVRRMPTTRTSRRVATDFGGS